MIRKRFELDCVNPPGQIVNNVGVPAGLYKPVHGGYPSEKMREIAAKVIEEHKEVLLRLAKR